MHRPQKQLIPLRAKEWREILLYGLVLMIALLANLIANFSNPVAAKSALQFWLPLALSGGGAFLLAVFVVFLKREPSRAAKLKQKLESAYLEPLTELIQEDRTTSKA